MSTAEPPHWLITWLPNLANLRDALGAAGMLDKIGPNRMFMTLLTAVDAYQRSCGGGDVDAG